MEFGGELNDRAQIDVAPGRQSRFQGRGESAINGGEIRVVARELELIGDVNGPDTSLDVTLTKNGSLKFRRVNGGVRLEYRKANASDPAPHIDNGMLDARAVFREGKSGGP